MHSVREIPCSVGILTFNSEKTLRRTLESVKGFSDIIISDGGSTDSTLSIAEEYNARVIDQYTKHKPSGVPFHPIEDFAKERNKMLDAAKEDWFFWLDSDEYISSELYEEIKAVCSSEQIDYFVYSTHRVLQNPTGSVTYQRSKKPHQIRLFNLRTNGRFEKIMHEKFVYDTNKYKAGVLKGSWYVPLSRPDFKAHKKVVNYRFNKMLSEKVPKSFFAYVKRGIWSTSKAALSTVLDWIISWIKYSPAKSLPFFYYRNTLYSQWVIFKVVTKLYFKSLFKTRK